MDLNSGPPATGKGEIWENMRLGREKEGGFASKVWVLVLTMCSFGLSLESDTQRFVGCGMLSKSHALVGGELPPLSGISLSRGSSCLTM